MMTDFFTELSGYEGKFGRVTLQKLPLHRYPKTSTRMIGEVTKPNNHASKYFYQDYYVINPTFQDKVRAAKRCQELLRQHAGKNRRTKVVFYPEEEWAKSSPRITWVIKINRWWKRRCTVVEHRAGHTMSSTARIIQNHDETITIRGRFTRRIDPDFRLHLSSQMNRDEFARGYLMTGALQLGDLKGTGQLKITHFAVLPRL